MPMFSDIDWTENSKNVIRFLKRTRLTQKDVRVDIGHVSIQEKKKNGMDRTLTNLKEMEFNGRCHVGKFKKKVGTQYFEVSVR